MPKETAVGDRIAVLCDGHVPFVLTSVERKGAGDDEVETYQQIGEAYVHGIMKGEAFRYAGCCHRKYYPLLSELPLPCSRDRKSWHGGSTHPSSTSPSHFHSGEKSGQDFVSQAT